MANSRKGTAQVNPPTPKQRVNSRWGSKVGLVDEILGLIGESDADVRQALMGVSNLRLMSHHRVAKRMVDQFGSREGLVDAIVGLRFPKGPADENVQARIASMSAWRLMDEHRQTVDRVARLAKEAIAAAARKATRQKRRAKVIARRATRG